MAIASGASVARLGTGTTGTGGGGDDDDDGDGDDDERRDGREMRDGKRRVKGRTSSEAVTEFVTYACATSEGGCALARRETTRGAAATTSRSRELARDDGDGEAMTAIAMDENARRVFCASRSGRVVRVDVVEGGDGTTTTRRVQGVVAAQVVAGVGHVRGRHGDAVVHGERG